MNAVENGIETPKAVLLPCEPDQFRDFIAGLLGRPQTISRIVPGPFEVGSSEIDSLYHLLDQRLASQNEATLIQFTIRVVYDDKSSILLNSFEEFKAYNEVKPLRSVAAHLGWTWLVRFRTKQHQEKQQIDVSFISDFGEMNDLHEAATQIISSRRWSQMRLRISHTDRTWATDIDSLITGQLQMLRKPIEGWRALAWENSGRIGVATSILVLVSALIAGYAVTTSFVDSYLSVARTFAASASFEDVPKKIDFLINVIASGMWTRYSVYVVVLLLASLISAIVLGVVVGSHADTDRPSFVLLTRKADDHRRFALRRYENSWLVFCASLGASIVLSVFGNFLFYKIMQLWALPT